MDNGPSRPVRIALDAMGGDFGPPETVPGALLAAGDGDIAVTLVGDPTAIQAELARHGAGGLPVSVVPADGVIQEGESPVQALRQRPRASVVVATALVREGKADALVTMGSTGAAMAACSMLLGLFDGIERPALGGPILGLAPRTVVVDLGSNLDCRPAQLLDFAALGVAFARAYLGVPSPRVALLSVGAEEGKGNRQVKESYAAFKGSGLNFVGNVEGHDLPQERAEVVVCDGFVGNVLMKAMEGVGVALSQHLRRRLEAGLGAAEAEAVGQEVHDLLSGVEHTGGGPLFGVRGVAVVGHGRARASSIASALRTARLVARADLLRLMEEELHRLRSRSLA